MNLRFPTIDATCGQIRPQNPTVAIIPNTVFRNRKRKRCGIPFVDGLMVIEPNPGPEAFNPITAQSNVHHEPGPHYDRNTAGHYVNEWKHGQNEHWYQPASLVGTDSALPPALAALTGFSNQTHTGESHVTLAKPRERQGYSRKRTGNPVVDGLVGIEPNPGPKQKQKKIKAPKRKTRAPKVKQNRTSSTPVYAGAYSIGASMGRNLYRTGKPDGLIADCIKIGGVNVKGSCFSNLGVGTDTHASPGDYAGLFLDGAPHTTAFIAFNFEDFDDRIRNLAETYQYYRVRYLRPRFIPMVGTTVTGQWAFSISDNVEVASTTTPTSMNSLLTSNVSGAGTAWVQRELPPYEYNSAKVWSTVLSAGGTDINNVISEQLLFTARVLIPSAAGGPLEYGRIQFEYSIDFFEPRGNVGTVTLRRPTPSLVNSVLTNEDRKLLRFNRNLLGQVIVSRLQKLIQEYNDAGKNESKECDSPFVMEQNPLTQSIHIPKTVVEKLALSLRQ